MIQYKPGAMPDYQKNTLERRKFVKDPKRSRAMRSRELHDGQHFSFTGRQDNQDVNLFAIYFSTDAEEYRLQLTADKARRLAAFLNERLQWIDDKAQIAERSKRFADQNETIINL